MYVPSLPSPPQPFSNENPDKQVFPSLEFIGWYTVSSKPSPAHIALHTQFTAYCSTPLLLLLSSSSALSPAELPFKAYEPTIEIRDRASRAVFVEAPYAVETGEAERIAVDWTARGGGSGTSLESHLQTQRAAVKMLYDRIVVLVQYVSQALDGASTLFFFESISYGGIGSTKKDHSVLRSIAALIASLPASENRAFREEFDTEYEDVQITAFLSSLTKTTNMLNDASPVLHFYGRLLIGVDCGQAHFDHVEQGRADGCAASTWWCDGDGNGRGEVFA